MLHVLLPLKRLEHAKSRLNGLLRPSDRRELMMAMVEDVLAVLCSHSAIDHIWLVSSDPVAGELADRYRANWITEWELGCAGLNAILGAACRHLRLPTGDCIMLLHADLPWLVTEDIDVALATYGKSGGLLLAPDRHRRGTNLLLFEAHLQPQFQFGEDSFHLHRNWARERGVAVTVIERNGTENDIDLPTDIEDLLVSTDVGKATAGWLKKSDFRRRLSQGSPQPS